MATLITGAGLVGTSFARVALERGEKVVFLDSDPREAFLRTKLDEPVELVRADLRDLPALVTALRKHAIDTVVHTAGLIGRRVSESLATSFEINVGGTSNVAEAVRQAGVSRLVHISSTGVYDWRRPTRGPVSESFPRGSGGPYSNFNVAKELVLEAHALQDGFELAIIRTASVIGLGHGVGGSGGTRKIRALAEAGLSGEPAKIPAHQAMAYEYVYAKDLGRAIDLATTGPLGDRNIFNIAYGRVTTFEELVTSAQRILPRLQVEILPGERSVDRTDPVDITHARDRLHWQPEFSLDAALEDYLAELSGSTGMGAKETSRRPSNNAAFEDPSTQLKQTSH